jgi:hypothetical protein
MQETSWSAADNRAGWDILSNNGMRTDDGVIADGNPRQHHDLSAKPYIASNRDRGSS